MSKDSRRIARQRRHLRIRAKMKNAAAVPRLCSFRSLKHMYAQVVDDSQGHTLASASTLDSEIKSAAVGKNKTGESELVGSLVAKRALSQGINQVVFDRGGYKYHGRVKALAEAARREGLKF